MPRGQGTGLLNLGWLEADAGPLLMAQITVRFVLMGTRVSGQGSWSLMTQLTGSWAGGIGELGDVP